MTENFTNLGLKKDIISAITALGFTQPTDVQKAIIPLVTSKKNVAFTSQTGSGKTIGFSAGFFSSINQKQGVQALIIVPTRELCMQVGEELKKFGDLLGFTVGMLYGGHDLLADKKIISKKLHVVVATPGRLIQHINFKTVRINEVKTIVFDESDQMFDSGFYDDCIYIKSRVSVSAQVILSSATITPKVSTFLKKNVSDYEFVEVGVLIPPTIIQDVLFCSIEEKPDLVVNFFLGEEFTRAIVFVNTKAKLDSVTALLNNNDVVSEYLSGDLDQKDREKRIRDFKRGKFSVLVCTDVAARGLDIDDIDIILNYDVPTKAEFYVHRIGRTGRAGKEGYALTFICPEDEDRFQVIEDTYNVKTGEVNFDFELVD